MNAHASVFATMMQRSMSRSPVRIRARRMVFSTMLSPTMGRSFASSLNTQGARRSFAQETVSFTYIDPTGEEFPVEAEGGKHLLDVAHDNNIELEGACGGELACSTCHLVFEEKIYDKLPPMSEEEEDMLDLAFELTDTSRLGCQIQVTKDLEGMTVRIPDDGY